MSCLAGKISVGAELCRSCPFGNQMPNANQTACVCNSGFYDRQIHGVIKCSFGDYQPTEIEPAVNPCISCRDLPCLDCDDPHALWLRTGFARAMENGSRTGATSVTNIYECPGDRLTANNAEPVCHRTTIASGVHCEAGFGGPLCQMCEEGFAEFRQRCQLCRPSDKGISTAAIVISIGAAFASVVYMLINRCTNSYHGPGSHERENNSSLSESFFRHENPVSGNTSAEAYIRDFEETRKEQPRNVWLLLQMLAQPVRILVSCKL